LGLEICSTEQGGVDDNDGLVEFIASYRENGVVRSHHEISRFKREAGRWYYVDGDAPKVETYVKEQPKVGRNDPCPCGSGKKYKKCCGR
jgi:SEC-C motif-containing protein